MSYNTSIYLKNGIATGLGTHVTLSNQHPVVPRSSVGSISFKTGPIISANYRGPTVQRNFNGSYQGYRGIPR